MSEQSEALRLAQEFEVAWSDVTPCVQAALMLRRQHSRIEADEALMKDALSALSGLAKFDGIIEERVGDYETGKMRESITALRTRLDALPHPPVQGGE